MSEIKIGSKVWHCYFFAHNINQFVIKDSVVDRLRTDIYSDNLWAYDESDKIIGRVDEIFLTELESIKFQRSYLENRQDEIKANYEKERDRYYKLLDDNKSDWLKKDSNVNNKISYLRSLEAKL